MFVCILYRCGVPVVLRPGLESTDGEEGFRVIGECYLHGMMDGDDCRYIVRWQETFVLT